jgi:hypothetical protein
VNELVSVTPALQLETAGFDLKGVLAPTRFVLDQDSNASVSHFLNGDMILTLGMDRVVLTIDAVFLPRDVVSVEFYGLDHLPLLKAILPSYRWVVSKVTNVGSSRVGGGAYLVQDVIVEFQGVSRES